MLSICNYHCLWFDEISNIYPTMLLAWKIEETLVVKLEIIVTFLWWTKASVPLYSKIPLDEVSAPSELSLVYWKRKIEKFEVHSPLEGNQLSFQPCSFWKRATKMQWNFYVILLIVTWRSGLFMFVEEDILTERPCACKMVSTKNVRQKI